MANRARRRQDNPEAAIARILLVSTELRLYEEIESILGGAADAPRVIWVSEPAQAVSSVMESSPQTILVDQLPGPEGSLDLIRELAIRTRGTPIIALVPAGSIDLANESVIVGARGFATKPLDHVSFVTTLQRLLSMSWTDEETTPLGVSGHTIVFCSPKGGTGRSMLAVNTALGILQTTSQSVALVDADFAAPAIDVALNLPRDRSIADLVPRIDQLDEDLITGVLDTHVSGLKILSAPQPSPGHDGVSLDDVHDVLTLLEGMFPWVVVDLGLPIDESWLDLVAGADRVVVCMQPEMVGLRNARLLLDRFADHGLLPSRTWLVLNRSTIRGAVPRTDIENRLGRKIMVSIPDDQKLVTASVNRGIPLILGQKRSAVARGVKKLAARLVEDILAPQVNS